MIKIIDKRCLVSNVSDSFTTGIWMHCKDLNPSLRRQCLLEVGIAVDESTKSEGL